MLEDGRYSIIGAIDVFSRRFKMLVSKTSKSVAVAALIRKSILDWGVPETTKTDNGADYVSDHIVYILKALEIEHIVCPPFTPESKPHIERAFKTFSHSFLELMPGYIGHSVADRKGIEARKSFSQRFGNKGSEVSINMTADELQQYCDRWCDSIYHQRVHKGLDGKTPTQVAKIWHGTVRQITNPRALDILLAEAPSGNGFRTVTKKGIIVNKIDYVSDNLAGLEGERVRVKLDSADLGTIYLFDESHNFITTAVNPERTGINRAEMATRLKATQKKWLKEGSKELRKVAKILAIDDIHEEILAYHESKIANIIELPVKGEEYTTKALQEASKAVDALDKEHAEDRYANDIINENWTLPDATNDSSAPKKDEKVVLLMTDSDRYVDIKTRARKRGLSQVEYDFLTDYYTSSRAGRMYLELEGDLRVKLGLTKEKVNKG